MERKKERLGREGDRQSVVKGEEVAWENHDEMSGEGRNREGGREGVESDV